MVKMESTIFDPDRIRLASKMLNLSLEKTLKKRRRKKKKCAARSWIEATFQKRDCVKFIPSPIDEHRCCCGQSLAYHSSSVAQAEKAGDEIWSPSKHTMASPTDAYGTIEFQGGPHPSKAQYVRLAYDTRPELILQLFTREWSLELPKLLITVQGGKANFELQPKLKKILRKGLLKAAKTTGAWIFTGGTNTGVTRQVGDALLMERSQRSGRIVSIGIAPWGIVENNHELIGHNRDVPYHSISSPRSKYAVLNNRHAYFLLVDNGTGGRYGAEIILRRKLEKYISIQKLHPCTHCSTPVVCLVIEGGTNTIRAVLEYVTDSPPVPVVVCDGSGRAADLLAFVHKYASETGEQTVLESMKEYLINTIERTFEVGSDQAECLYNELLECTRKKNLITVFRISERSTEAGTQELDQTILTALFKSQHLSPSEQLSLALTWNRVDIARSEIFVYGQEWPTGALDEAMMQALEHDRIDFVKLLLENGVSMKKFLTIPRLEELYNTKQGPTNTLGYILRDVRPNIPRGYIYTLHDIGLVINKLMGGAYRASYTRRKFRVIYTKVMKKSPHFHRNSSSFIRYYGNTNLTLSLLAETLPTTKEMPRFDYPFNELLIWAVLTKRQEMALLMWQHGEEALAKALVACKLYKAMAHEAAEDDLETEIYDELRNYGKIFEDIALELLDFSYRQDDDQTQQLLTCELQNWSGQTCLSLAVAANHRPLLAHPCSQIILADLWMGGLRTRKNTNLKIILGLFFPIYITRLEFKSKEELQLMPQTEEEHLYGLEEENEKFDTGEHNGQHRNTEADIESARIFQALISQETCMRDTVVTENGKVLTENMGSSGSESGSQFIPMPTEYTFDIKQNRPLKLKRKLYEFYTAPITKFWANAISYVIYLVIYSYVILVRMDQNPSWQELYIISYISTLGCEKVREIVSSEPVAISHKFAVWTWNMWNPCDAAAIIFFLFGLSLRLKPSSRPAGRVIFCVDIIYWYLRILNILGVNKYLGPLVTMMGKMVKNMIYFVVLLLVVLMSFGVCRQAILFPEKDPSWSLVRDIFFQPYFMLYGELFVLEKKEVFADQIDPPCGEASGEPECQTGRWITPLVMSMYLLVANILLINLLIAVFNNIFIEVNAVSHQVWMFQRFTVVMEYEQKPALPPPFIFFSHIVLLFKYLRRKCKGVQETYDNGLKLFLDNEDLERLYDFEEECVEGYFREQEMKLQASTDERIKQTNERVDNINQKVEDINQKENNQNSSLQSVEFRLRKLEESQEQTLSTLSVIHRFMALHSSNNSSGGGVLEVPDIPELKIGPIERLRRSSERSDILSETSDIPSHFTSGLYHRKRPPVRSMTEVRPSGLPLFHEHSPHTLPVESVFYERQERQGREHHTSGTDMTELPQVFAEEDEDELESDTAETSDKTVPEPPASDIPTVRRGSKQRGMSFSEDVRIRRSSCSSGDVLVLDPDLLGGIVRQLSQTHSEPGDNCTESTKPNIVERSVTWAEPRITVIPPSTSGSRSVLMAMHSEYTSITDELETVCGLLSPPRSPRRLSPPRQRHQSEMSNPEMALYLEKEHLRGAEESDYQLLEGLIHQRLTREPTDSDKFDNNAFFLTVDQASSPEFKTHEKSFAEPSKYHKRISRRQSTGVFLKGTSRLRRSSAIEIGDVSAPVTPAQSPEPKSLSGMPDAPSPLQETPPIDTSEPQLPLQAPPQTSSQPQSPQQQRPAQQPVKRLSRADSVSAPNSETMC
ncbi:transient receptor potential cation channel trpm isoform X4 [Bemisia tabaci]|uniref:transient receptor potential cation channel trpm isoform X4 n=1 Tax=Bemisia tabaci TaxID=7038 RepID=UPI003B282D2C